MLLFAWVMIGVFLFGLLFWIESSGVFAEAMEEFLRSKIKEMDKISLTKSGFFLKKNNFFTKGVGQCH